MAKDLFTECAEQLAASPDLVTQLLAEHSLGADGWCRGHSAHRERFPCSIRRLAELAAGGPRGAGAARSAVVGTAHRSG